MHDIAWKIPSTPTVATQSQHWQRSPLADEKSAPRDPRPVPSLAAVRVRQATAPRLQAKLTVSHPGDSAEVEADRVADRIVQMPDPGPAVARQEDARTGTPLQRKCEECQDTAHRQSVGPDEEEVARMAGDEPKDDDEMVSRAPDDDEMMNRAPDDDESVARAALGEDEEVQRAAGDDEDEQSVQAKSQSAEPPRVTSSAESEIRALRTSGTPMSATDRQYFEPRFGADFSQVRVHTGSQAAGVARQLDARAFTVGDHITFGAGQYSPGSPEGKRLMAHELTHVLQQRGQSPDSNS